MITKECVVFSLIGYWILTYSTVYLLPSEKSVQAVSEGSDCRCKCILLTEDGGPCDDGLVGGARKTIYTVETISGGSDCRCYCNTPPPAGCEAPRATAKRDDRQLDSEDEDSQNLGDGGHEAPIDLIALHSSISNMVAAMVKLERAVQKTSSPGELSVLRSNVNKVVDNLKSTNGTYNDLLVDLNLDSADTQRNASQNVASGLTIPSLEAPPKETKEEKTASQETIGVVPTGVNGRKITPHPTSYKQRKKTNIGLPESAEKSESEQKMQSIRKLESSQNAGINANIEENLDIIRSFVRNRAESRTIETSTMPPETINTPASTEANAINLEFDMAPGTGSKVTTVDLHTGNVVKPEVIFVPYRSIPKSNSNFDAGPPGTSKAASDQEEGDEEYYYDYDYLDIEVRQKSNDTSNEPTSAHPEEDTTSTLAEPNQTVVIPSTIPVTDTPLSTPEEADDTDEEDTYGYFLGQYEYNDDYYDDEVTTTASSTTATATKATLHEKCGTIYNLSKPILVSHFGRKEGAWMRDPVPSKTDPLRHQRIYVANFYYGSNLIEFDDIKGLKDLRWRNSYHLPHKWIGTGHIVYNGSFYYNRAFSRSLIKYNLQYRFVSAWSHLTNAIYDPTTPFTWRGHSMVHMAADEDGLWVIFPSQDPFDASAKLTYVINKINPVDLRIIKSFKSKIRQSVSHVFIMCGVVYSTEGYNFRNARVTHAFDTKTSVQRTIYLGFENMFSYTVQFLYNPKERKIYAWDHGRQIEYQVGMVY